MSDLSKMKIAEARDALKAGDVTSVEPPLERNVRISCCYNPRESSGTRVSLIKFQHAFYGFGITERKTKIRPKFVEYFSPIFGCVSILLHMNNV